MNNWGFTEYFGQGRTKKRITPIITKNMTLAGIGNPANQNLDVADNGSIRIRSQMIDNAFTAGGLLGMGTTTNLPPDLDTSFPFTLRVFYAKDAGTAGNVVFRVDYILTDSTFVLAPGGTPTTSLFTTGNEIKDVSGAAGQQQVYTTTLDVSTFIPGENVFWFQVVRNGPDASDTYADSIFLIMVELEYVSWNNGFQIL